MFSDKNIYIYADGERRGDPLAIQRRLFIASSGKINDLIADHSGDDRLAAAQAEELILSAARSAFVFDLFEYGGPPDADVLDELNRFTEWLEGKESRGQSGQDSARSTGCPPISTTPCTLPSP